jgi:hypothetical protein
MQALVRLVTPYSPGGSIEVHFAIGKVPQDSKLVHGSELDSEVWEGQLKVARDFARRSLLWFLSFLEEFSKVGKRSPSAILAERKEILAVIDWRAGAIIQLAKILKSVPPSFPAVKAWQEPWTLHR